MWCRCLVQEAAPTSRVTFSKICLHFLDLERIAQDQNCKSAKQVLFFKQCMLRREWSRVFRIPPKRVQFFESNWIVWVANRFTQTKVMRLTFQQKNVFSADCLEFHWQFPCVCHWCQSVCAKLNPHHCSFECHLTGIDKQILCMTNSKFFGKEMTWGLQCALSLLVLVFMILIF